MENMENMNMGTKSSSRSIGPIIGLVVIIAVILLGGIYFWSTRNTGNNYTAPKQQNDNSGANNTAASLNTTVPSSYNSASVEAALNDSDPSKIDTSGL